MLVYGQAPAFQGYQGQQAQPQQQQQQQNQNPWGSAGVSAYGMAAAPLPGQTMQRGNPWGGFYGALGTTPSVGARPSTNTVGGPGIPGEAAALQAYQQRQEAMMGGLDVLGRNQLQDASTLYNQKSASAYQDAINRGLTNTTVRDSLQRGVERDRAREFERINNDINQQKLALQSQASKDTLTYLEGRQQAQQQAALERERMALQSQQLRQQQQQFERQLAQERELSMYNYNTRHAVDPQNMVIAGNYAHWKPWSVAWPGHGS